MKSTGVVRKIDELGRIVLPIEIRKTLNFNFRDPLEIFTNDDTVVLKKYTAGDVFTGDMDDLVEYKGCKVSLSSIKDLAKLAGYKLEKE